MELPVERPDATAPAARRFQPPDLHRADATLPAQLASDASVAVLPDAAAAVEMILALAAERYVEKLAVLAPGVPAPDARLDSAQKLPEEAMAPYTPDAGQSAA
jgi:hypothetical protein